MSHDNDGSDDEGINLEISEQEYSDELEHKSDEELSDIMEKEDIMEEKNEKENESEYNTHDKKRNENGEPEMNETKGLYRYY